MANKLQFFDNQLMPKSVVQSKFASPFGALFLGREYLFYGVEVGMVKRQPSTETNEI
ncbi:MAG: hypothetical protein ACUVTF_05465 [bacterium]